MILPRIPYPLCEFISMVKRRYSAPPKNDQPAMKQITLNLQEAPDLWIGFVGDICPQKNRRISLSTDVLKFFDECTIIIGNFEGVITDQSHKPFMLKHSPEIFDTLNTIKPIDRWILSVANNHAIDYGIEALEETILQFEDFGIRWFGTKERPYITIHDKITVTGWTWWMNGRTDRICDVDPGPPNGSELNIAFPHWGYEHERQPRLSQKDQVPTGYDMIVGHHSHLPQPLARLQNGIPIVWSLGNFVTANSLPVLGEGAILKAGIILNKPDKPEIQSVHYRQIELGMDDPNMCRISFRDEKKNK